MAVTRRSFRAGFATRVLAIAAGTLVGTAGLLTGCSAPASPVASSASMASTPSPETEPEPSPLVDVTPSTTVERPTATSISPHHTATGMAGEDLTLTITSPTIGTVEFAVYPMTVAHDATMVAPPEPAGCPWTDPQQVADHAENPDDVPPGCNWLDTSVWIRNAAYPTAPPSGITYIYAHACRYHLCPLSAVRQVADGVFSVQAGDSIELVTRVGQLRYRICGVGDSPKSGPLAEPRCGQSDPDLVIVTCNYDAAGRSVDNIVIAAELRH